MVNLPPKNGVENMCGFVTFVSEMNAFFRLVGSFSSFVFLLGNGLACRLFSLKNTEAI